MAQMSEEGVSKAAQERIKRRAMAASLAVAVLMLVGKLTAAVLTGSDAILSDAAESIVHIIATVVAAASLWYAAQPADRQHPYGHGRIAYFSAGAEGAMIFVAAVSVLIISARSLWVGAEVQELGLGLAITAALGVINLVLGLSLIRVGRQHNELVLVANGQHVLTDMWTSLGVVVGVVLVWATGVVWLDPVVAFLAGLHILYGGASLLREAYNGLMDRVDQEDTQKILARLEGCRDAGLVKDFHQLHFRRVHVHVWIEVHLIFPADLSLVEAHERATEVEGQLARLFEKARVHVTSHLEPLLHHHSGPDPGHGDGTDPLTSS